VRIAHTDFTGFRRYLFRVVENLPGAGKVRAMRHAHIFRFLTFSDDRTTVRNPENASKSRTVRNLLTTPQIRGVVQGAPCKVVELFLSSLADSGFFSTRRPSIANFAMLVASLLQLIDPRWK
jgi:hypothetical protein